MIERALLGIEDMEGLLSHPVVGASWEGFVLENLLAAAPEGSAAYYYRSSGGAEIDLLIGMPGSGLWAIEIKRSTAPSPTRGFHEACADVNPQRRIVVYPGAERFPLSKDVEAVPLQTLAQELADAKRKQP